MWNLLFLLFLACMTPFSFADSPAPTKPKLTVCTDTWTPFTDKTLPGSGQSWRIIQEVMSSQGYDTELTIMPWARAVRSVKDGECDALADAFYTKDRTQWARFSAPYGEVNTVFFKRTDREIPSLLMQDLKDYRIGIIRGAAASPAFDSDTSLNKHQVRDIKQGLTMLYADRLDLLVAEDIPALYQIQQLRLQYPNIDNEIQAIEPFLANNERHLAISKQSENGLTILRDFNRGLIQLIKSGKYKKLLDEY